MCMCVSCYSSPTYHLCVCLSVWEEECLKLRCFAVIAGGLIHVRDCRIRFVLGVVVDVPSSILWVSL